MHAYIEVLKVPAVCLPALCSLAPHSSPHSALHCLPRAALPTTRSFSDKAGALGSFAASAEFAFGTIVQRTMDTPGNVRMHYGHPDVSGFT